MRCTPGGGVVGTGEGRAPESNTRAGAAVIGREPDTDRHRAAEPGDEARSQGVGAGLQLGP